MAPGGVQLRQRRSQEGRGSLELQIGSLGALEEAWDGFLLEALSRQGWSFSGVLEVLAGLEAES